MEKPSLFDRLNNWARRSITLKLISITILVLLLLIPTFMLTSLVAERQSVRDEATREVSSKWGDEQTIGGPVITIPYTVRVRNDQTIEEETRYAHFLPDVLNISGTLNPEKRYRGIYVIVLYNTKLHVSGDFNGLNLGDLDVPESDYQFQNAFVSIGIPDMKGITENISFKLNDTSYSLNPGVPVHDVFGSGASFKIPVTKDSKFHFEFDLSLNGSTSLSFLPFGKETNVLLQSSWGSPSFDGSFLPDKREITSTGFNASWKVLQLNRNYPQQGTGTFISGSPDDSYNGFQNDGYASFGVRLLLPVDEYQKTTRSVKYCIMFIIITFLTFFFTEVLNKRRIHAIQYMLVGFAICLFYVLLLAISEHLTFNLAYLVACVSTLALITLYAKTIFKNNFLTAVFAGILAILYGFFYSLLQLEDYALLLGSIGLFLILATIMYLTRKVDWYGESEEDLHKVS